MAREQGRKEMNYEQDLRIDEMALDVEWLEHAKLSLGYSFSLADATRAKEIAKQNLLIARAEVREELDKLGKKVTEGSVEEELARKPEYAALIEANYQENRLDGAVKSMGDRKKALEKLVDLIAIQYFAGPREPRDLHREVQSRESTRKKIGTALNK